MTILKDKYKYISNVNIIHYLKYILKCFNNDIIYFILDYLIPQRNDICLYYGTNIFKTKIDYIQFVYQVTKTILFKYKYFNSTLIIPYLYKDALLLLKNDLEKANTIVLNNLNLFYKLFIDIYCDFYNFNEYICIYDHDDFNVYLINDYIPYKIINEKYFNFIYNNNIVII
jgi:hypothetical protein